MSFEFERPPLRPDLNLRVLRAGFVNGVGHLNIRFTGEDFGYGFGGSKINTDNLERVNLLRNVGVLSLERFLQECLNVSKLLEISLNVFMKQT